MTRRKKGKLGNRGFSKKPVQTSRKLRAYIENALAKTGKLDEAVKCFQRIVELDQGHAAAKHHLSALTGQTTEAAPREYVETLFDRYARTFDEHLVEKLEYRIPKLLRRSFDDLVETGMRFINVVDLGCGTGLSGMEFRSISNRLTGIDISSKMIEEARKKGVHDVLHVGDMVEYLERTNEEYDLFLATDVFVYVGDLEPVFAVVRNRSLRGAYFAFSTESCQGENFVLRQTGRYAHSLSYVKVLAARHNFAIQMSPTAVIRRQEHERIMGNYFILKYIE